MQILVRSLAIAFMVSLSVSAACSQMTLTTTYSRDNGQDGVMFDVVALQDVVVCSLDMNLEVGVWDIEVYSRSGGYAGVVTSPGAWGMPLASLGGVVSSGVNVPTSLRLSLGVGVSQGSTQAFYVTASNGAGVNYSTGMVGSSGSVAAQDGNLQVLVGSGVSYAFGMEFPDRVWNGTVRYVLSGGTCAPPLFQRNQMSAQVDFEGVESTGNAPAVLRKCVGEGAVLNVSSPLTGAAHEIAWTFSPLRARGVPGAVGSGMQTINIDAFHPSRGFLFGGQAPGFMAFPGSYSLTLQEPFPFMFSVQMAVQDASHPEGFAFSQGASVEFFLQGLVLGPVEDDSVAAVDVTAPPLCRSGVTFYGTTYSTVFLSSNGRLSMIAGDDSFAPSVADALSDDPFIGCWSDFDPSSGGQILAQSVAPNALCFTWDNVAPFAATPGTQSGFQLFHDTASGVWEIRNLALLSTNQNLAFFGISRGSLGATDPGPQIFGVGTSTPATATDMLYEFGQASAATPVASSASFVRFTPTLIGGLDGYSWEVQ